MNSLTKSQAIVEKQSAKSRMKANTVNRSSLSVIIPSHNEQDYIDSCLQSLLDQSFDGIVDVVLIANACRDKTVERSLSYKPAFRKKGWVFRVLRTRRPGKVNALNCADKMAQSQNRLYLDADVVCQPNMIEQLVKALDTPKPMYLSGKMVIAEPTSWFTKRYKTIWEQLPFMRSPAVGAGLFCVNAAGRKRWDQFPDIISDDTFVRLQFSAEERSEVGAKFTWPLVEGFANLVKVRRRQDAGVEEISALYPQLMANEAKPPSNAPSLALKHPISFAVYCGVRLCAKLTRQGSDWTRGR